jgi:hypothetical protein
MRMSGWTAGSALVLVVAACADQPTAPSAPVAPIEATEPLLSHGFGISILVTGVGVVDFDPAGDFADGKFAFVAMKLGNGKSVGTFYQSRMRATGLVEFAGVVTCVTIDPNFPGRARIGGIVTKNNSTDPAFLTENHEVGDDVWFRVEDNGPANTQQKSTTYGFKPTLVNTSAEYCALPFDGPTVWNPATIFPLAKGFIDVKPGV